MLEQVWQEYRDRDVVVLGVNAQDFTSDARGFVERYGMTYPVVHDGAGLLAGALRPERVPGDVVDRSEGAARRLHQGPFEREEHRPGHPARALLVVRLVAVIVAALALAAPAAAADPPTLADLEDELICPTCETSLEMSNSPDRRADARVHPGADRRRGLEGGDQGRSSWIEFGEGVLAAPAEEGVQPARLAPAARRARAGGRGRDGARRAAGSPRAAPSRTSRRRTLDPALERRLDDELARFDG